MIIELEVGGVIFIKKGLLKVLDNKERVELLVKHIEWSTTVWIDIYWWLNNKRIINVFWLVVLLYCVWLVKNKWKISNKLLQDQY